MDKSNTYQTGKNINDHLPSMFPVADEKYSNIKIYDNQPMIYKDSPFESRNIDRRKVVNKDGTLIKQQNQNDANSEFSEEHSENFDKSRKMNEIINYISEPYNDENFKPLKVKSKINSNENNNQISQMSNTINQAINNQETQENYPSAIYNNNTNNNIINNNTNNYNQNNQNQTSQQNNNFIPPENPYPEFTNTLNQNRVQHKIQNRQKHPEENSSKRREDPRDTHHGKKRHKSRKIKVEIAKTEPNYDEYENGLKYLNETYSKKDHNESRSNLSNTSFNNKNIDINNKSKNYKNDYYDKVDPNILNQFKLIKELESNNKIKELERQKKKLSK